jgi:hypothetical protein
MRRDEAFLAHHVPLAALIGILLVYSVLACGVGLYLVWHPEARQRPPRGIFWMLAIMLIASGIVLLYQNKNLVALAGGSQILAALMLLIQSLRLEQIWRWRIGGLALVLIGLYWGIAAALMRAGALYGYRSWFEGAGGILVLLGIAMLWLGDGGWFAPLAEVELTPPSPRPLRKFGGKI